MSYEGEIRTSHPKKENTRARNRSARLVSWLNKYQAFSVRETTVSGDNCQMFEFSGQYFS